MAELTGKERMLRLLDRRPLDRIPVFEHFWPETVAKWRTEGRLTQDESPEEHFGLDMQLLWPFNLVADLDFEWQHVEETEETKLVRDGNGALLRWWKNKSGTPEHVDFAVKERKDWEDMIRPHLFKKANNGRRIKFERYRELKAKAAARNVLFGWSGINVFECMHPVCGHENLLVGMALDPDWVTDMCNVYSDLIISLMEELFAREGKPDVIWFYEDLGFKEKPFMSPAMYKALIFPGHKKTFDYAHSLGLKVFVHICGYVEPLIPGLIEAGMDCLQAMEVKAGMDLLRLKKNFGDRIALMGGMDIRALETNDNSKVMAELKAKLPGAMAGGGYCLHTDHSIPPSVEYETYKYFLQAGRQMGKY
ncbi:MAG: hypothetical protein HZA50_18580 [Planctomycetes bacterium]|nr:hypothetical protein [Planctomycetota bacterium]